VVAGDLFLVLSNPVDGQEDAYNRWYDQTHLPEVLSVPGVVAAQRYELVPMKPAEDMPTPADPEHRYLAVYELDRDAAGVMAEFMRRVTGGEMVLSESLDITTISLATWRPRGQRVRADGQPTRPAAAGE
jgi:hypothetical protein